MDIYFSPYELTPLKKSNRLSSLDPKSGVFLKMKGKADQFADYFPHLPLGDRGVDQFLSEFKFQKEEYDRKVLHLLVKDASYQGFESKPFANHQLWTGQENIESPVIKYKLLTSEDILFHELVKKGIKIRLDGNAIFTKDTFAKFLEKLDPRERSLLEYVEDPVLGEDWADLSVPAGRDFIMGSPYQYYIYKPNCEFYPETNVPVIFSAYLGNTLGIWHTYCEMMERADLSITHGIISGGFYKEEKNLWLGDYFSTFRPDLSVVNAMYDELSSRNWKFLCSI